MNALKEGLEPVPPKMRGLKIDERGYPVPWFVAWVDGKPEFRCMDAEKWRRAIKQKLCWVCGNQLGVQLVFPIGPMCGVNRTTSEPPCHEDCARYSVKNCPFLSQPNMLRREDEYTRSVPDHPAGVPIMRNPGVTLLWFTREYELFPTPDGGQLIHIGRPFRTEWWREGRMATRAEVEESIETGLPILQAVAIQEKGAMEALQQAHEKFKRFLPPAD